MAVLEVMCGQIVNNCMYVVLVRAAKQDRELSMFL